MMQSPSPDTGTTAPRLTRWLDTVLTHFAGIMGLFTLTSACVLYFIYIQCEAFDPAAHAIIETTLLVVFAALTFLSGIAAWVIGKAHDRRRAAERLSDEQNIRLTDEIAAHNQTEAALKKARDAAEAANLAKSRYLIGVSHEIRSPLNAIYGYAQLLERDSSIPAEEAGRVIRQSSEHLTNIVDGLLDISRIESGILKLNRDTVPLSAFLEAIAEMFQLQAADKGLAFHYHPSPSLPAYVRTDEKRLRQILINLLSNAIKYTPSGGASLSVRHRGMIAEFEIADTGIGIAPEDIDRIFEPFERGGSDIAHAQPGTGLGLAITRVLTQVMGGDITVSSTPGQGSRFILRLMLAEPAEAPAATARQRLISGYAGRRRTILIIDDDPAQLAVIQGLLRPLGFAVYAASSGNGGIELAQHCQPDLILLDIQMPGVSGWNIAATLRALDNARARDTQSREAQGQRLKITMVSANAHEFSAGGDGRADHDGFVPKPVELETLLDVIAAQLGLTWEAGIPAARAEPAPKPDLAGAAATIADLRRLGQIGHVRGIEARLDDMAAEFPASLPLVVQLRERVRAFDLKAYLKLLEPHE